MVEGRKQAVSIRMTTTDVRKVKRLASRLGVRDSDVIRFAVKSTLAKLGPLYDPEVQGRNLVPVFVEWGSELLRFFDLDAARPQSARACARLACSAQSSAALVKAARKCSIASAG